MHISNAKIITTMVLAAGVALYSEQISWGQCPGGGGVAASGGLAGGVPSGPGGQSNIGGAAGFNPLQAVQMAQQTQQMRQQQQQMLMQLQMQQHMMQNQKRLSANGTRIPASRVARTRGNSRAALFTAEEREQLREKRIAEARARNERLRELKRQRDAGQ